MLSDHHDNAAGLTPPVRPSVMPSLNQFIFWVDAGVNVRGEDLDKDGSEEEDEESLNYLSTTHHAL